MSFGDRLQALRRGAGMTQEDFAQQLKVSRQAVSKWESSHGYPEIEKIIYICNHYGLTMDELFCDEVPAVRSAPAVEAKQPQSDEPLRSPPLKKAFSNFFVNLSPLNQLIFGVGAVVVLLLLLILFCANLSKGETNQMAFGTDLAVPADPVYHRRGGHRGPDLHLVFRRCAGGTDLRAAGWPAVASDRAVHRHQRHVSAGHTAAGT